MEKKLTVGILLSEKTTLPSVRAAIKIGIKQSQFTGQDQITPKVIRKITSCLELISLDDGTKEEAKAFLQSLKGE